MVLGGLLQQMPFVPQKQLLSFEGGEPYHKEGME